MGNSIETTGEEDIRFRKAHEDWGYQCRAVWSETILSAILVQFAGEIRPRGPALRSEQKLNWMWKVYEDHIMQTRRKQSTPSKFNRTADWLRARKILEEPRLNGLNGTPKRQPTNRSNSTSTYTLPRRDGRPELGSFLEEATKMCNLGSL